MQQVLSVKIDKETVISKPFDFECMCIIDDARQDDKAGMLRTVMPGVRYLFEGTAATDGELDKLPPSRLAEMCRKVFEWYAEAMTKNA